MELFTVWDFAECRTHGPNDCRAADLDGDGEYETVVKWDPTNAKDNTHDGYTGNVYLDAYKLNGTQLWRIDLGRNSTGTARWIFNHHGDALHVGKFIPSRSGLQVFKPSEWENGEPADYMLDASTGQADLAARLVRLRQRPRRRRRYLFAEHFVKNTSSLRVKIKQFYRLLICSQPPFEQPAQRAVLRPFFSRLLKSG